MWFSHEQQRNSITRRQEISRIALSLVHTGVELVSRRRQIVDKPLFTIPWFTLRTTFERTWHWADMLSLVLAMSWGRFGMSRTWPVQNFGWVGHSAFGPTNNWPVCSLILRKISKTGATRWQILRLKCTKFALCWGSSPVPDRGAHSTPSVQLSCILEAYFQGEGEGRKRGREGKEKWREGKRSERRNLAHPNI